MYIGIDVGTSSLKALLMSERQRVLASAELPLKVSRPKPGWSEQSPASWWRACLKAIDALASARPQQVSRVCAIGMSGQMHGATLLDASDRALRPCILWNDVRSAAQCERLEAEQPKFRTLGGNIAMPGFTAPKLRWIEEHEPEIFEKVSKVLLPKDYVRLKLSGDHASDMSDSSGTLWMDVAKRDWCDDLLKTSHLGRGQMPVLVEGSEASGRLRAPLAKRWTMAQPPLIAGGGGDNAASACGSGTINPGDAFVSLGTSGVLFVSNARFSPNTEGAVHAMCHAIPATWHQMGVILSAASAVDWLAGVLGSSPSVLFGELKRTLGQTSPVLFAPYLSGERTPHNDADVRGGFVNLEHASSRVDLLHAVLDGVAFAMRDCLEALKTAGTRIDHVSAVGGGSRSPVWLDIIANVLGIPVNVHKGGDRGAAFGAARLAMLADTGADPASVLTTPPVTRRHEPDERLAEAYNRQWQRWSGLYPALRHIAPSTGAYNSKN